jgi:hypothetical protein
MSSMNEATEREKFLLDLAKDETVLMDIREWVYRINSGKVSISECTRQFASEKIGWLLSYIGRIRGSSGSLKLLADENARLRMENTRLWKIESKYRRMTERPAPELPDRLNQPA